MVPAQIRIFLEIIPYVIILGLLLGLQATRGTLQRERDAHTIEISNLKAAQAAKEKSWADQQKVAIETYTEKLQDLQPVIVNSIDAGKAYANTPAGKQPCLTSSRVHDILASRNAEFASATRSSSTALRSGSSNRK